MARTRNISWANGLGYMVSLGVLSLASPSLAETYLVANSGSNTVSVIDSVSRTLTKTITVGSNPQSVAISPDGRLAYTANAGAYGDTANDTVSIIDMATEAVIGTITVGDRPYAVTFSPDSSRAYVANYNSNTISVIDTSSHTVLRSYSTGAGSNPISIAVAPNGRYIYVANFNGQNVKAYSTTDDSLLATIPTAASTYNVIISRDGTVAYAMASMAGDVFKIDPATHTSTGSFTAAGTVHALALSPDKSTLYAPSYTKDSVVFYGTNTFAQLNEYSSLDTKKYHSIATSSDGATLLVADWGVDGGAGSLSFIDAATASITKSLPLGIAPSSVAVVPIHTPAADPTTVPTLTEWAMILMGLVLAGFAALTLQRRRQAA